MTDFLYQRKQRDVLNEKYSSWAATEASIPQGSIPGPRFLDHCFFCCTSATFFSSQTKIITDDSSLFFVVENMTKSANVLISDFAKISSFWKGLLGK